MDKSAVLIVVLAAGKGTRMKSTLPKVLHKVAGRSMLAHVLDLAAESNADKVAVVVGPDMADVEQEARAQFSGSETYLQSPQRGTADAVLAARKAIEGHSGDVIVLYADTPLIRAETIAAIRAKLDTGVSIAVLGFRPKDPTGYGRLLTDSSGGLLAIREEKDATDAARQVGLCNSGVMAFRVPDLVGLLERIGTDNAKQEYYLTDAVGIARQDGLKAAVVECEEDEVLGVNARNQLAVAESIWQRRARQKHMANGVCMTAPETVFFSFDTKIASDVSIEPNVFFGCGVTIESGVEIKANCYIEGAHIGENARVGPFARFRPGTNLGSGVRVGNFVEMKNVTMGTGAKANHLSYLGDGVVGAKANVGAGTIFCNYDGFNKHRTEVGEEAFIGSNSSLVAPVKIGARSYIGSGSVITKDVAPGALALERSAQEERSGWAEKFRLMMSRRKGKAGD